MFAFSANIVYLECICSYILSIVNYNPVVKPLPSCIAILIMNSGLIKLLMHTSKYICTHTMNMLICLQDAVMMGAMCEFFLLLVRMCFAIYLTTPPIPLYVGYHTNTIEIFLHLLIPNLICITLPMSRKSETAYASCPKYTNTTATVTNTVND